MEKKSITLYQLNKNIQECLHTSFDDCYWIIAEIAQIKENFSGHCYLELIEKAKDGEKVIAQTKAVIWSFTYRMLKPYFETSAGTKLCEGLKILVNVKIEFHELYGLSLNIIDIEPNYTAGDLALKRKEIIEKLIADGIFEMNRQLNLPSVPQRLAVISSETAAGFEDFINHLGCNQYGYRFSVKLFPAFMQGDRAEDSIINSLDCICSEIDNYDVVIIIRGGGSQADLSCFDSYLLASHVAQFPLPVITGIGHEQDESIVDMVAHTQLKTPTAVANFIVDRFIAFESYIISLEEQLTDCVQSILNCENDRLQRAIHILPLTIQNILLKQTQKLQTKAHDAQKSIQKQLTECRLNTKNYSVHLSSAVSSFMYEKNKDLSHYPAEIKRIIANGFKLERARLEISSKSCELLDPISILKKGYSLTFHKNVLLTDASLVNENDLIETRLFNGNIQSKVTAGNHSKP